MVGISSVVGSVVDAGPARYRAVGAGANGVHVDVALVERWPGRRAAKCPTNLSGLGCAQAGPFRFCGFWAQNYAEQGAAPNSGVWASSGRLDRTGPGGGLWVAEFAMLGERTVVASCFVLGRQFWPGA